MDIESLRARLPEIRAKRNDLQGEVANLEARAFDVPAGSQDGYAERLQGLRRAQEKLESESKEIEAEIAERGRRVEHVRDLAGNPNNREAGAEYRTPAESDRTSAQDGALRAIERHHEAMADGAPEALEGAVRRDHTGLGARYLAAVGDAEYRSAFGLILTHPSDAQLRMTPAQLEAVRRVHQATEARALAEGVGSTGGFGLPLVIDPTILLASNGALNPVRQLATVTTIATNIWKGVSSEGVTAGFSAEATEVGDNSPTLAQPEVKVQKAQAFIPFSIEVGQDYPGIEQELEMLLSDARDILEAEKFLNGTGEHEPAGLLTGLAEGEVVGTAGVKATAIGDIYALREALPPRFIPDSTFAGSPTVLDTIYRFVGGGSVEPPLMPTRDGALLGRPKAEWSGMSTGTATTGNKILLYGDFDNFRIVDRIGMTVEVIQHLFGANRRPTGQRGLYAYWRTGSAVTVANGFRVLEVK